MEEQFVATQEVTEMEIINEQDKKEETTEEMNEVKVMEQKINDFFIQLGLSHPIDFVFLSYSQGRSRERVKYSNENLIFLFHLITNQNLTEEKSFPRAAFLEKVVNLEETFNIIWTLSPSEIWASRTILPFENFHLYFMNILSPAFQYSVEDLYKVLKTRKGESYFLHHGARKDTETEILHILFVTPKVIIAFQVGKIIFDEIEDHQIFVSKWISENEKSILLDCQEKEIFEFPPDNFLDTIEDGTEKK